MMGAWKPWVLGGILSKCDKVLICKRTPKWFSMECWK
jgi:hypothetical protein